MTVYQQELARIRDEYRRRAIEVPTDRYCLADPANLFFQQHRLRCALSLLFRRGIRRFDDKRVLEIGCGSGVWLRDFAACGVSFENLAGIDLDEGRVVKASRLFCDQRDETGSLRARGADIRCGDASELPWPDSAFDIVLQATVFTSILNMQLKQAIAREMVRVVRPNGAILWYDFAVNNPRNPAVKGIQRSEIRRLFPNCALRLRRVTLAPPLARRLVPWSWWAACALESLRVLNTHWLGTICPVRPVAATARNQRSQESSK